jgi:thioredoxin 1
VKFVKVDKEENPKVSDRYNVIVVPTILIFKNSQLVKKLLGFQDRSSLRSLLDSMAVGEVIS